jgi:hypothetical protein
MKISTLLLIIIASSLSLTLSSRYHKHFKLSKLSTSHHKSKSHKHTIRHQLKSLKRADPPAADPAAPPADPAAAPADPAADPAAAAAGGDAAAKPPADAGPGEVVANGIEITVSAPPLKRCS